ncbi:Chlorophyll A-B binding family protein [Abeliophyllum distichum]|uniref:Chlorophyll A-B binding family protein n=1 Tax=Abeliophyllum distichum TaxID=126358 RepID=A0ABD1VWX0_9LAMI
MASVGVTTSIQRACNSQHITKKQPPQSRTARLKKATNVVTPNFDGLKLAENQEKSPFLAETPKEPGDKFEHSNNAESLYPRFSDERWKNGTWDLNMFVKHGRMDWDAVIVAGRAAMVGVFMAYVVDALTGLDVVGQAGNFICKAALFVTIIGVIFFRKTRF